MTLGPSAWIVLPLLGGVIGYVTNRIAVKMVFRPIRPVSVLGFQVQGLVGRRQPELAASIGRVVGQHLVEHDDIVRALHAMDLEKLVSGALDRGLEEKVAELRMMPLVGGFLTDERVADLRESLVRGFLENEELLLEEIERAVEEGLDVQALVREKVAAFPVEQLEKLVLEVAARELRAIEVLGGVLGLLIGFIQVAVLELLV
jgi:uncharacterized membrane protein YheB (UPF0754 family)